MKQLVSAGLLVLAGFAIPGSADSLRKVQVLSSGGAYENGKPLLTLEVMNPGKDDLWVSVRFESPKPEASCEVKKRLLTRYQVRFACEQTGLDPAFEYKATVKVSSTEDFAQVLEEGVTSIRLDARKLEKAQRDDAAAMKRKAGEATEAALAWQLPREFPNMAFTERLMANALVNPLFPFAVTQGGTLTVTREGLDYKSPKKTLHIPLGSIRGLGLFPPDALVGHWIAVAYEEGGEVKKVGFKEKTANPDVRKLGKVIASIGYAQCLNLTGFSPGQTVPGTTQQDPVGQCGTFLLIQAAEKDAGSTCAAPQVTGTEVVAKTGKDTRTERWHLDRCGTEVSYRIEIRLDNYGNPMIGIKREDAG
jgi:hypothetical protein